MKVISIITTIVLLSGCVNLRERGDVRAGIKVAKPVILIIEQYKSEVGRYPSSIGELTLPESTLANLYRHGVQYKTYNKKSEFGIAFGVSGFITKPWCSYGSIRNEWQCLYK